MKIEVSKALLNIFEKSNKNWNYAIDFLLGSMDPVYYKDSFEILRDLNLDGEKINIEISDSVLERIKKDFGYIDSRLVEILMWIATIFPEV